MRDAIPMDLCKSLDWCRHNNATLKLTTNGTVLIVNDRPYIAETIEECVCIAIAGEFRRHNNTLPIHNKSVEQGRTT